MLGSLIQELETFLISPVVRSMHEVVRVVFTQSRQRGCSRHSLGWHGRLLFLS